MGRIAKRLNFVSRAGPSPTIQISGDEFERLEAVYRHPLDGEARNALTEIADAYLYWRATELSATKHAEVRGLFERVKQALEPFWEFASGSLFEHSDASASVEALLDSGYARHPFGIDRRQLSTITDVGEVVPAEVEAPLLLTLSHTQIMHIGISLKTALASAEAALKAEEQDSSKGFAPGDAFSSWLLQMREWAKTRGFLIGGYETDRETPSPFSHFLFEINEMFAGVPWKPPGEDSLDEEIEDSVDVDMDDHRSPLAEPVKSPAAIADRLKTIVAAANRRHRGE